MGLEYCQSNNHSTQLKTWFMKKFFTLFLSSLFSLSLLAFDGSKLSISTVSNKVEFKFEVDGRKLNLRDNSITLSNISEGSHSIRIYKEKVKNNFGFARKELVYAGTVFIRRGFHTDITVNRFGKVFTDERRIQSDDDEWGYTDEDQDYDTNEGWDNGYGNVMSMRDFDLVKEQLRSEWSEKNRLSSAKVIADKSNFTTAQVKEMMLLFSFESNRLELAKYAFRKTVDKQNYYKLDDALTFQSSKDELARFVRGK
jgi:hypothetical protein